jgi:hypothetical protein
MRLIVEIQRIGNQLLDIDLRRTIEAPTIAAAPVVPSIATAALATTVWTAPALATTRPAGTFAALALRIWTPTLALWTIALRPVALRTLTLRFPLRLRRCLYFHWSLGWALRLGCGSFLGA